MAIPTNLKLYNEIKNKANSIYSKPSAYKSGYIVKEYKRQGGKYIDDNTPKNLKRWFKESWKNVSSKDQYPVLRPTIRVNKKTPLLVSEIKPSNLIKQIKLKQVIKGKKNLPKFL
jgi:hypothetical protein